MDRELILRARAFGRQDAGLTLIELLVVVTVLAVLGVGASLVASGQGRDAATSDRVWFETQFAALQGLAVQGRTAKGLSVSAKGLSFARMTPEGWQINPAARRWRGKVSLTRLNPPRTLNSPDIVLLANGQSSAFDIQFTAAGGTSQKCRSDGWAGLSCDAP